MHLERSRRNKKEVILMKHLSGKTSKLKTSFSIVSTIDGYSTSNVDDQNISLPFFGRSSVCDGILFVSEYSCQGYNILCNIATRGAILLPKICSGNNSITISGFGCDLKNHLYKVVRIAESAPKYSNDQIFISYHVKVFTLGSSWREGKNGNLNSMKARIINCVGTGFYFNGAIHWQGWYPRFSDVVISLFNLSDEEFQMIPLPDNVEDFNGFLVWNGRLAVGVTYDNNPSLLDIFVMKEHGV
ncbi:hypothetical protein DITRI_Ditri16bG0109700 [Diplodiscus trichospermus]